ncbi:MAG: ATP-binding cassette domain-containing protein [Pseudomonadota bacterium]|nr:ATP-binding cassette domain-containing protein [Pseudomonadota bacterium]
MENSIIQTKNLNIYHETQCILRDININIQANKTTAFMGPSGVGKSSLLQVLCGQKKPKSGQLTFNNVHQNTEKNLKTGILFQNNALLLHLTVFENVALPIRYHFNLPETIIEDIVLMKLHAVNLKHAAHLYPEQLSGGMLRRAAIARSIAMDPNLIFYDEPFSGQDPINTESIAKLIKKMNKYLDATSIIITHEVNLTLQLADYIYIFDKQTIAFHGPPHKVTSSKNDFVKSFLTPSIQTQLSTSEKKPC